MLEGPSGARFCPEIGSGQDVVVGFPDAESAMLHIFEVLPNEAHRWCWVPITQLQWYDHREEPCQE